MMVLMGSKQQLIDWLNSELYVRGWSQSEFARRGGISSSQVSLVLSGQSAPGDRFLKALSEAFELPEMYFRSMAGLLPRMDPETEERREAQFLFSQLIDDDQTTVLTIMRALLGRQRAEGPAKVQSDHI